MAQLLIRDLEQETIDRLKLRAQEHHRSLQSELKSIVEAATKMSIDEARKVTKAWQARLAGKHFSDSASLIREDRDK